MYPTKSEIMTGIVAGILGCLITVGIVHWFTLPAPVDLLVFTESAFGIGMTVIALVFSLVLVNQVREVDKRFDELVKRIDHALEFLASNYREVTDDNTKNTKPVLSRGVAGSGTIVGPDNTLSQGYTVIKPPKE